MELFKTQEVWFVVGSQHLYGNQTLSEVEAHARQIVDGLNRDGHFPVKIVLQPLATRAEEIVAICRHASYADNCIGVMAWMHTFSPAKMWIGGLTRLDKPLLQFHTQFSAEIPWSSIDMAFMNLNQTAHGGREFGFIGARLRMQRTVVVGHWKNQEVQHKIDRWIHIAAALHDSRSMKVARFGDNMREVAVTEGDKVEAQIRLGYSVNGYAMSDLTRAVDRVSDTELDLLIEEYESSYLLAPAVQLNGNKRQSLRDAARIEIGIRTFLQQGGFSAFTTTFENLDGLKQLPGLAVQRLMQQGYGFGAEGDWKTAALLRTVKVMGAGAVGGTSFMEDYTYHFSPENELVLGAHMLEVCPSIAEDKPLLTVLPLSIGGKEDPARLIFSARPGPALNASLLDMGNRFRLLVNEVDTVASPHDLPELPVARALWKPKPCLATAAEAWILAGGAHHTVYSQAVNSDDLRTYAEMVGIEYLTIDAETRISDLKNQINWNEVFFAYRQ